MYLRGRISRLLLGVAVLFGVIGMGVLFAGHPVSATSGINEHINFQGRLFNAQGATVPDGNYNIQFKIYQDGAGTAAGNPGGTLLWTENWLNSGSHGVQVKNGYLSVELGTVNPFGSSIDWNQDTLWLSMNIGDTTSCTITTSFTSNCGGDGEMVPMKRMSSTPYSLNSGRLGGLTSAQFLQLAQGVQTDASNATSLFLNKTGTGNLVQLQSSSTDVFTVSNSGNLAFGANSDHTISVTTASAGTGGKSLTVSAGAGGSGTGSTGGDLVLQGGAGGGTNGNGGNVVINAGAKTGTGASGSISIGTSNTASVTIGADTALSAGKSLTITGGNTASRPASPTEGMIYYDTTTKQMLIYANGKWQADRQQATLVAASNSTQAEKDAADFVATGTGDQSTLASAVADADPAGSGRKTGRVYLFPGTFSVSDVTNLPNNVTLEGAGTSSIVKFSNIAGTTRNMFTNTTTNGTGITIRNLFLDGNNAVNTTGTQHGIYMNQFGDDTSGTEGATITNVTVANFHDRGIYLDASDYNTVSQVAAYNNGNAGIFVNGVRNTVVNNSSHDNVSGITLNGSLYNNVANNKLFNNSSQGIYVGGTSSDNNITNNVLRANGGSTHNNAIYITGSDNNDIVSNAISDTNCTTDCYAINIFDSTSDTNYLADNSLGSNGTINDAGTSTRYGGQTNGSAYVIQPASSFAMTGTAASTISTSSGALTLQGAGGINLNSATSVAGNLTVTSAGNVAFQRNTTDYTATGSQTDVNFGTGALFRITSASPVTINSIAGGADGRMITLFNAGVSTATLLNDDGTTGTASMRIITGTGSSLVVPAGATAQLSYDSSSNRWRLVGGSVMGSVGANTALSNLSGVSINASLTPNANNTLDLGTSANSWRTLYADTSVLTPTLDTESAGILSIGTTNATQINLNKNVQVAANQNLTFAAGTGNFDQSSSSGTFKTGTGAVSLNGDTTVAAGKSLKITGGNTASRPASPTEGMVYYDTDTKQLLTYANGKWQGDRKSATTIIAPSNASQSAKDSADVVLTGTADQSLINTALSNAAGGKVYIMEGTVNITDTISVPDNTTLAGAGYGTLIQLGNVNGLTRSMITNSNTTNGTGIVIRDMRLDGNNSVNTTGTQYGVYLNGTGNSSSGIDGGTVTGLWVTKVLTRGIYLNSANYNLVTSNFVFTNSASGIYANGTRNTITSNDVHDNGTYGIVLNGVLYSVINSNQIHQNTSRGIDINGNSSNNTINSNNFRNNGGTTTNNAIYIAGSTNNAITSNNFTDSNCSTSCYAVNISDSASTGTYLSDNQLDTNTVFAASGSSPIYGGQLNQNGTGTFTIQNAGGVDISSSAGTATNNVSISTGNASAGNSGSISLDVGTATGTKGSINIGTTNALSLSIGNSSSTTTVQGNLGVTLNATTGTIQVCRNASGYLSTCDATYLAPTATNFIQNGTSQQASSNFNISGTGIADTLQGTTKVTTALLDTVSAGTLSIGTTNATQINLNKNVQIAANQNITFAAGSGSFDQSSSTGTFKTGTGAVSLNGDTTVATGKNFTVTNGTTNVTGATNVNTSGSATTTIGNASATNTIAGTTGITGNTSVNTSGSGTTSVGNSSGGAINIVSGAAVTMTAGAASTWSTSSGSLTLQGGGGVTITTPNTTTSSAINIQTGNSTSGTAASVNVDTGTSSTGTSTVNIGTTNAGSVVIGKTTTTATVQGGLTVGASAGTGTFTNNGSTKNTTLALGDLAAGAIGTAANTVDKYTSFTISPTASGRTYTIPAPTDGAAGRTIYISNINGTNTFIIGSTTFSSHSTATLVYDGSGWNFAGMDGGSNNYIQNQVASAQTAGFNINGTGTAATLQAATFDTASSGVLAIGTTNATQINLNKNVAVAANQNLTFASGSGSFDMSSSSGTFKTGTGAVSLNGDTTVATGKNLTVTNGTTSITGATNVNTSGTGTTTIGNSSATNTIAGTTGITGNTSINTSGSGTTSIGSGSAGAIGIVSGSAVTLTAGAASTLSTSTGTLTLQGGSGVTIASANATTSGAVSLQSGNSSSGTAGTVTVDTGTSSTGTSAVNIGTGNAGSVVIGKTTTTTTIQGNLTAGASAGTGTFTNNGSTKNTTLALGDLAAGAIGTAANTVDKYTSFTISPTASGRTYTIPAPTDGAAGRTIYISNINGSNTFIIGSTTFSTHSTATLVYDGTSWNFAGMDGGSNNYIQNQTASAQAAGFNINGTGTAATLQAATFDTASSGVLAIGTTNATQINLNKNVQVAANQNLTFASGSGSFDMSNSSGTFKTGTGAVSLNGDTTVATGKNFTVTSGTSNITGTTNVNTSGSATTTIGNASATNTIAGTTGITGATSINTSGSANTSIGNGSTGTVTVGNASTGAVAIQSGTSIGLTGNTTVTGTTNINTSGSAATSVGSTSGGAVSISAASSIGLQAAASGTITLGSQTAANTLNIGSVGSAAFSSTINIGTSTGAAQTVTVGSAASTSSLTLQSGSGALALQSQGTINIGTNAVAQTVTIGNNTGATSVVVDCGTGNCNFGTTATSHTTNIGSTSGSSTTNLQGGTGGVTINTAGTVRATFTNANSVYFGNGVTAAAPNAFTISGTGSSTTAVAGGALTVQGGNATTGSANGGNLVLTGGSGVGTGVNGLVVISTPTFQTVTNDANCYTSGTLVANSCTIAQTSIDNSSAVLVGFNAIGKTATMPDPTTTTTAGRVVYVTAANGSSDFTLSVNGGGTGNTIAMRQNTTATMIWNGSDWTAAGASSSTTLQSAYDNTLQSAGGAELVVSKTSATNGLTIRDSSTNAVNGTLLSVQSSSAANLFSVNSNVTEYASNAGAETYGGTTTTFPSSTWSALTGASVSRNITTANIATGQGSAQATTTTTAGSGIKNQLTTLTAGQHYNVSFTAKLSSGTFTDMGVYYSIDGTTDSVTCTTGQAIKTSVWTKVNCTFTAPSSGITSSNSINIRQVGSGTARTFYVDNLSVTIAADYNYATDGTVNDNTNFATNWAVVGTGSVSRNTSDGQEASDSAQATAGTTANNGIKNKLSINPLTSTLYRVSVYAKLSAGSAFTDFKVRYTPDNGTNFVDCVDYNGQTVTTSGWTQITCYINTSTTTVSSPYVQFIQPTAPGSARTFLVDSFSMTLASSSTPNVQIGGSSNGGPTTLFTLDRGASAPIAANNDALLGSMYYDTTLGKLQCYEADGWGACGSSPDNIVTISPEYTNAVLHGTGVGTMTSDLCSDTLDINDGTSGQDTICGSNETYNFYKWTSPQTSSQTYSIYVTYQLPSTFKAFQSGATSIMGRTDNGSSGGSATVSYKIYRNNSASGLTPCGNSVSVSTGTVSSWQTGTATGAADPSTCGFAPGDSVVFKIDAVANKNANAYIGNLNFTFSNR